MSQLVSLLPKRLCTMHSAKHTVIGSNILADISLL